MAKLDNKVALVTGAGRGIGEAIARGMASEGARVYCVARSSGEIEAVAESINGGGGDAEAVRADLTDEASLRRLYDGVRERDGGLDVLVANAGISGLRGVTVTSDDIDIKRWREIVEVNLFGTFDTIRLAVPLMRGRGGRVIVTGSGAGHFPIHGMSAYAASKSSLWMLVRILAEELRDEGISINELIPGPVVTELFDGARAEKKDASTVVKSEWVKGPEDVVPLALFLATQPDGLGPTGQSFSLTRRAL